MLLLLAWFFPHELLPSFKINLNLLRHFDSRLFLTELFERKPKKQHNNFCLLQITICCSGLLPCVSEYQSQLALQAYYSSLGILEDWKVLLAYVRAVQFFLHRYISNPEQNGSAHRNVIGNWLKYIPKACTCECMRVCAGKGEMEIKMLSFASNFWYLCVVLRKHATITIHSVSKIWCSDS